MSSLSHPSHAPSLSHHLVSFFFFLSVSLSISFSSFSLSLFLSFSLSLFLSFSLPLFLSFSLSLSMYRARNPGYADHLSAGVVFALGAHSPLGVTTWMLPPIRLYDSPIMTQQIGDLDLDRFCDSRPWLVGVMLFVSGGMCTAATIFSRALWPIVVVLAYGAFRTNFHPFDRIKLDLRGHIHVQGAAFSWLRLKSADLVLI